MCTCDFAKEMAANPWLVVTSLRNAHILKECGIPYSETLLKRSW